MKKIYTVFLLSVTFSVFSQVKESSQTGYYLQQNKDEIKVWNGYPSGNGGNGQASFTQEGETIKVVHKGEGRRALSPKNFSSPNDVVMTRDAAGNTYWVLIDGTVVKSDLVSGGTSGSSAPVTPAPAPKAVPAPPKAMPAPPVEETVKDTRKIIIDEAPEQAIIQQTEVITTENAVPEEITVTTEEVGDASDLFEKNYDDMTPKEKKLYKKNEKKIMKQLEKELKEGATN